MFLTNNTYLYLLVLMEGEMYISAGAACIFSVCISLEIVCAWGDCEGSPGYDTHSHTRGVVIPVVVIIILIVISQDTGDFTLPEFPPLQYFPP